MKSWTIKSHLIAEEFFQYSLLAYLLLFLTEKVKEGFVSFFFNINYLLIVVLLSGIITMLTHQQIIEEVDESKKYKPKSSDLENIAILGAIGFFLVFTTTRDLGVVSYITSILTATIIVLISLLMLHADK